MNLEPFIKAGPKQAGLRRGDESRAGPWPQTPPVNRSAGAPQSPTWRPQMTVPLHQPLGKCPRSGLSLPKGQGRPAPRSFSYRKDTPRVTTGFFHKRLMRILVSNLGREIFFVYPIMSLPSSRRSVSKASVSAAVKIVTVRKRLGKSRHSVLRKAGMQGMGGTHRAPHWGPSKAAGASHAQPNTSRGPPGTQLSLGGKSLGSTLNEWRGRAKLFLQFLPANRIKEVCERFWP